MTPAADQSYTPTIQQVPPPTQHVQLSTERQWGAPSGASLMEMSAFMTEQVKEQVKELRDHDEKVRQETKLELEAQRQETEEIRKEANSLRIEAAEARARAEMQAEVQAKAERSAKQRDQQLGALLTRIEALRASKLLTDDVADAAEDIIADAAEAAEGDTVSMLVALSVRMTGDSAFARQLRRKVA